MGRQHYLRRRDIWEDLGICRHKLKKMLDEGYYPPPIELSPGYEVWPRKLHEKWKDDLDKQCSQTKEVK